MRISSEAKQVRFGFGGLITLAAIGAALILALGLGTAAMADTPPATGAGLSGSVVQSANDAGGHGAALAYSRIGIVEHASLPRPVKASYGCLELSGLCQPVLIVAQRPTPYGCQEFAGQCQPIQIPT